MAIPELKPSQMAGPVVDDLAQEVSDAISKALGRGLGVTEVSSMVAIVAADFGRIEFGEDFVDYLAGTIKLRRDQPLPEFEYDQEH